MLVLIVAVRLYCRAGLCRNREIAAFGTPASLASVLWVGFQNIDFAIVAARMWRRRRLGCTTEASRLASPTRRRSARCSWNCCFLSTRAFAALDQLKHIRTRVVRVHALIFPLIAGYVAVAPVLVPWLLEGNGRAW